MVQTIGIELEGFFADGWGEPVDTARRLGGPSIETGRPFEGLTTDMARSSFEMITTPCTNAEEVRESLERVRSLFPKGLEPIFKPRPFPGVVEIVEKQRARVMRRALLREHPDKDGFCGIDKVAPWCALHAHIAVSNVESPEAVLLQNVLNDIAPYAHHGARSKFEIQGAEGHLMIWQGWCRADRVPNWRWFQGPAALKQYVHSIPKLIMNVGGEWKLGDGTPSAIGDNESEGTLWWLARPRGKLGTIEWRPFPSMSIEDACEVADEIFALVHAFHEYVDNHPAVLQPLRRLRTTHVDPGREMQLNYADWRPIDAMYAHLARVTWLVPMERHFNDAGVWWWDLYRS